MKIVIALNCLIFLLIANSRTEITASPLNNYRLSGPTNDISTATRSPAAISKKKRNKHSFIKIGLGSGVWSQATQPNFDSFRKPYDIFIEYQRENTLMAWAVEANILSSYSYGDFILNPNYFSLYPKAYLSSLVKIPDWFDVNALAGIQVSYTTFTDKVYPGISDYEYKIEKDISPGFIVGAGISFYFRNFEIRPGISYQTGKGKYYAGFFTRQIFDTSTLSALVTLSYKIPVLNKRNIVCPAYR